MYESLQTTNIIRTCMQIQDTALSLHFQQTLHWCYYTTVHQNNLCMSVLKTFLCLAAAWIRPFPRQMHTVSPSYSPTVARECLHIKCTVGLYDGNPNDLYSVDELKYFVDRTAASILLRAVKWAANRPSIQAAARILWWSNDRPKKCWECCRSSEHLAAAWIRPRGMATTATTTTPTSSAIHHCVTLIQWLDSTYLRACVSNSVVVFPTCQQVG